MAIPDPDGPLALARRRLSDCVRAMCDEIPVWDDGVCRWSEPDLRQDCELLDRYSTQVEKWVISAAELLGDRPTAVALRLPCPSCGERFVNRQGATIRQ